MNQVALVAGAGGIIGKALMEELAHRRDWRGLALARTNCDVSVDLTDVTATQTALRLARDTTHLFYAAYKAGGGLLEEDKINLAMLRNLLDGLSAVGAPLKRIVLYQGAKVYGVHLGPVPSPFYEDENSRPIGPNFYFTQEEELRRRADEGGPEWVILRPDVVLGDASGNTMNIATIIGAYAALSKANGAAFRFPGSAQVYDHCLAQFTDARALARASIWAMTAEKARHEVFNYVHAPFRWRRVWEKVATHFELETGDPIPFSLAAHMPALEPVWRRLSNNLVQPDYARAVGWSFGDFVFGSAFDVVSDTTKIRMAGFEETVDPANALVDSIERQITARILPHPTSRLGR